MCSFGSTWTIESAILTSSSPSLFQVLRFSTGPDTVMSRASGQEREHTPAVYSLELAMTNISCPDKFDRHPGQGLGGFTTVFDAEDQPAWLKSIALRFAVVASKILDEGTPDTKQAQMSGSRAQVAHPRQEQGTEQKSKSAEQVREKHPPPPPPHSTPPRLINTHCSAFCEAILLWASLATLECQCRV